MRIHERTRAHGCQRSRTLNSGLAWCWVVMATPDAEHHAHFFWLTAAIFNIHTHAHLCMSVCVCGQVKQSQLSEHSHQISCWRLFHLLIAERQQFRFCSYLLFKSQRLVFCIMSAAKYVLPVRRMKINQLIVINCR